MFCKIRSLFLCLGLMVALTNHGATQDTLFSEDFDAYTGRRPEGWRLWGELPPVGNYFRVMNGALYTGNGDDLILEDGYTFATVEGRDAEEWTDYTVEVDFRAIQYNGTILVVGRFQDSRNHYRAYFSISQSIEFGNERRAGIERVSDGQRTLLGEVVNGREGVVIPRIEGMRSDNEWRRVALAFRGDEISLHIDGEALLTVQDRTFRSGTAGVGQRFNAVYFDNFRVVAPYVAPIATALDRAAPPVDAASRPAEIQERMIESPDFADVAEARALAAALQELGVGPVETQTVDGGRRVVVGPFADEDQVEAALEQLRAAGHDAMRPATRSLVTITADIQDMDASDLERIIRTNLTGLEAADRGDAEALMQAIVAYMLKDSAERTSEEIDAIRRRLAELENQQEIIDHLNRSISEERTRQERIDELVAEISDAIDQRAWDQAEQQLERLRQLDPTNPHIDLKANALSLGRARITDLGAWINQSFATLENRVQTLDIKTVSDVQTELQAAEELRLQSGGDVNMLAQALVRYQSIQLTANSLLERASISTDLRNALEYARNQAEQQIPPIRADYRNLLIQQRERQENLERMADSQGTMWKLVLGLTAALVAMMIALVLVIRRQHKRHQQLLDLVNEIPARPVASIERSEHKRLDQGKNPKALEASAGLFGAAGGQVGDMLPPEDEPLMEDDEETTDDERPEPAPDQEETREEDAEEDEEKLIISDFDDGADGDVDMEETPTQAPGPDEGFAEAEDDNVLAFSDEPESEPEEDSRRAESTGEASDEMDFDIGDSDDMDFGLVLDEDEPVEAEEGSDEDDDTARAGASAEEGDEDGLDALDIDALGDMGLTLDEEPEQSAQEEEDTGPAASKAASGALDETRPMEADDVMGMGLDFDTLTPLEDTAPQGETQPAEKPEASATADSNSEPEAEEEEDADTMAMAMEGMDFDQELDLEDLSPAGASESKPEDHPPDEPPAPTPPEESPKASSAGEEVDLDGVDLLDFADMTPVFDEDDEDEEADKGQEGGKDGAEELLEDISDTEADEPLDLSDILGPADTAEETPAPAEPEKRPTPEKRSEPAKPSGEADDAEDPFGADDGADDAFGEAFDLPEEGDGFEAPSDDEEDRH